MTTVRVAAAQTPEFREDVEAALNHAAECVAEAESEGAALLCFPEGFLQGYLTDEVSARRNALDLTSPGFAALLTRLAATDLMLVMGLIETESSHLFDTAVVLHHGELVGRYRKAHPPGGKSIFAAGSDSPIFSVAGLRFGINICADTTFPEAAQKVADGGGALIVCPANNMLRRASAGEWKTMHNAVRGERCRETGLWLLSADVTGERDGRVGWGPTAVLNPAGEVVAQLPLEAPGVLVFDIPCGA